MKKRIFSILLSIGMMLTLLPGTVLAAETKNMRVATEGHGKVLVKGTDYGTEFQGTWPERTEVQVEAVPDEGYRLNRWWIRRANPEENAFLTDTKTTLVAGTDLEAIAYFGLEKAYVTITPPAAGTTAATAPQITLPAGAGYTLDPNTSDLDPNVKWVKSGSLYGCETLEPNTVFEAGKTYYAYVRLADGADSFAATAGGSSFDTDLVVTGGTKSAQGNFAATTGSDVGYLGIKAIIAVTIPDANTHTVTFDTQGNYTPVPAPQVVANGEKATRPEHPQFDENAADYDTTGLHFHNWYTKPANEISSYYEFCYSKSDTHPDGCIFGFDAPITQDMTAYAVYWGVLAVQAYDVTNRRQQAGGTFDYKNYNSLNYSNASSVQTTAFYNIPEFLMAKPADGYKFAGWSTSTSKDDIISTEAEYQYIFKKNIRLYALFEKEAPSYDLKFNFLANGGDLSTVFDSLTVNGTEWTLDSGATSITKQIPAGTEVTAVVKATDLGMLVQLSAEDLLYEVTYADDMSTGTITFTMPEKAVNVATLLDDVVLVNYDANGGTKGPAWGYTVRDTVRYPASLATTINSWNVDNVPFDWVYRDYIVYPPEGATYAGLEITDKNGPHTGAPGETITGLDLSGGATIKYLWTRDINKVEITLDAPVCGTETATLDKDYSWGSQTNPPSISVPDGAGYKPLILYEGASPAIWVNPDPNYEPFEGTIEGEESYTAQILLEPDSGAVFSEDVAVSVNGESPVNVIINTDSLGIIASVTAEHDPAEPMAENRVEPTCGTPGSYEEVVYCKGCGKELSRETKVIPATGEHTWDAGVVTTEPTCTTAGMKTFTCTVCGTTKTEEIQPLGHNWSVWTQTTAPTCTESGEETRTCERCKESETRSINPLGHAWDAGVVTTEPTCTTAGVKTFTCTVCGATSTEEIPALGHTPGGPVKEKEVAPTCTKAGSYDEVVYCTVCGEEISRNSLEIPALGHAWGKWTQTKAPTCTEPGEETRTCERCEGSETRSINPLGHAWGEWIIDKEATEDADGLRHRECSRCDAVEEEVIPMIVASYDIVEGDGATWYTGSKDALTFTFKRSVNDDKTFKMFKGIRIDGKEVAPANYTAKAGSVIITLKPEYIKTLAVGKHTLTAVFENGKTADATFTIAEKKADVVPGGDSDKKGSTPSTDKDTAKKKAAPGVKTGDNANSVLYMGLGIAALLIIAVTLILLKRRSRHEQ